MFVVLQPNSNTNQSDDYAVVDFDDWLSVLSGRSASLEIVSRHPSLGEAHEAADNLNWDD